MYHDSTARGQKKSLAIKSASRRNLTSVHSVVFGHASLGVVDCGDLSQLFVIHKVSKREYYFYAGTWVSDLNFFVGFLYSFLLKGEISIYVIARGNPSPRVPVGPSPFPPYHFALLLLQGPRRKKVSFLLHRKRKPEKSGEERASSHVCVRASCLFSFSFFLFLRLPSRSLFSLPLSSVVLFRQPSIFSGAGGGG